MYTKDSVKVIEQFVTGFRQAVSACDPDAINRLRSGETVATPDARDAALFRDRLLRVLDQWRVERFSFKEVDGWSEDRQYWRCWVPGR